MAKNYYITLGVPANSTQQDIKAAYRRLVKEFHPDHCNEGHTTFLVIQEAYSVLGDPDRRKEYDRILKDYRKKQEPRQKAARHFHETVEPLGPDRDFDFFWSMTGFGVLFEMLSGNYSARERRQPEKRTELEVVVTVSRQQALRGGQFRLLVPVRLLCPYCGGGGGWLYACRYCGGNGIVTKEHPVRVSFPPGVSDNQSLRLSFDHYGMRSAGLIVTFRISD
jgi:DnaJ-class molecular chaperone